NARRVFAVGIGKPAAADEVDAHDAEVFGLDDVEQRPVHIVSVGGLRLILEPEELLIIVAGHGKAAVGKADGGDAGHGTDLLVQLAEVRARTRWTIEDGRIGSSDAEAQDAVGVEAGIGVREREEAAQSEAGSGKKDDGGGHFKDDE